MKCLLEIASQSETFPTNKMLYKKFIKCILYNFTEKINMFIDL